LVRDRARLLLSQLARAVQHSFQRSRHADSPSVFGPRLWFLYVPAYAAGAGLSPWNAARVSGPACARAPRVNSLTRLPDRLRTRTCGGVAYGKAASDSTAQKRPVTPETQPRASAPAGATCSERRLSA